MLNIIVPVYNRANTTLDFIRAVRKQTVEDWRLFIIDDGCTDDTVDRISNINDDRINVISTLGNLWWGGSLHFAYLNIIDLIVGSDVVLIINDDVYFEESYFRIGLDLLENNPDSMIISSCYNLENGEIVDKGIYYNEVISTLTRNLSESQPINCSSTRGLFLTANDFIESGGFRPNFLPHYLSDYEYTIRLVRNGLKLKVYDSLRIYSDQSQTGVHQLPCILQPKDFLEEITSYRCSLNYNHWMSFINLTSRSLYCKVLSKVFYHLVIIKKLFKL